MCEHVYLNMSAYTSEGSFFFPYHIPERDIRVIGALSVLVSGPGLDKRDAADILHLLKS